LQGNATKKAKYISLVSTALSFTVDTGTSEKSKIPAKAGLVKISEKWVFIA